MHTADHRKRTYPYLLLYRIDIVYLSIISNQVYPLYSVYVLLYIYLHSHPHHRNIYVKTYNKITAACHPTFPLHRHDLLFHIHTVLLLLKSLNFYYLYFLLQLSFSSYHRYIAQFQYTIYYYSFYLYSMSPHTILSSFF